MAEIVWTEPALNELDVIAQFIALDNPRAAADLVRTELSKVERLRQFPESGRYLPELGPSLYREVIVVPCRVIYRVAAEAIVILHVLRDEQALTKLALPDA